MRKKAFWLVAFIYFVATTAFFLQPIFAHPQGIRFLYPNTATVNRIEIGESQYQSIHTRFLTRLFYNKPFGYVQDYLDNAYRSVDLPFLFTLTSGSSMYDDQGPMQMLYPWELILFIPATIFLILSREKKYILLFVYLLVIILVAAFFLPPVSQVKLLPEVSGIRLVIIFGLYEGMKKWLKK